MTQRPPYYLGETVQRRIEHRLISRFWAADENTRSRIWTFLEESAKREDPHEKMRRLGWRVEK